MSESLLNLSRYTSSGDVRDFANKVIDIGGYLGVCNGHYVLLDFTTKGKHYGFLDFNKEREKAMGYGKYSLGGQLKDIQKNLDYLPWQDMPTIKEEHYKECHDCNVFGKVPSRLYGCKECDGEGSVDLENEHNSYDVECKSCEGDGNEFAGGYENCSQCQGTKKHLSFVPMLKINKEYGINGEYVRLFNDLPNVKIAWHEKYKYYILKFTGGMVLVTAMRL